MDTNDPFVFAMAVRILRKNNPALRSGRRSHARAIRPARTAGAERSRSGGDGSTRGRAGTTSA